MAQVGRHLERSSSTFHGKKEPRWAIAYRKIFQLCCDSQPKHTFTSPMGNDVHLVGFLLEPCKGVCFHSCSCRNADSLLQFWSRWNTPALRWLHRHNSGFCTLWIWKMQYCCWEINNIINHHYHLLLKDLLTIDMSVGLPYGSERSN